MSQNLPVLKNYIEQIFVGFFIGGLGLAARNFLWPWIAPNQFVLFFPTVIIASFWGNGLIAGIAATVFSSLASIFFLLTANHEKTHVGVSQVSNWLAISIFFITSISISILIDRTQKRTKALVAAEANAEEGQRLKFAAMAAKVGIWEWEVQEDRLSWDEQMLRFYGIDRASFTSKVASWEKGLHPADAERTKKAVTAALRGEKEFDIEFRIVQPNGTERVLQANAFVMRDSAGNPRKMFGLNRDVTEDKRTLDRLQELNAFFQASLAQSQAGIVIVDAESRSTRFANEAAIRILNGTDTEPFDLRNLYSRKDWQMRTIDGKVISESESPMEKSILSGEKVSQEVILTGTNGTKKVVLTNTAPIRKPDETIIASIAVFFDVTERHILLDQLKAAQEAAEVAMRAKSRFLDIAAHELRTPVTAFSLLLQLTQMRLEKGHPVELSVLTRLRSQVDRLSRLVTDLLEVSRLDRGVVQLKRELTNLNALVTECCSNFKIQFPNRTIHFFPGDRIVMLDIDPVKIYEVLSNLVDNAIKYTPMETPIEISLESDADSVRVLVKDHGPGISRDQQKGLFKPFERGETKEEERHAGLGLGLFICQGIIELHGGIIGLKSDLGEGSTFYFQLPRPNLVSQEAS